MRNKNTITQDDRSFEQQKTHTILITATDKFMSGWGEAKGGNSKCAWACRPDQDWQRVYEWVKSREEMRRVGIKNGGTWYPNAAHSHVYVVEDGHPALR